MKKLLLVVMFACALLPLLAQGAMACYYCGQYGRCMSHSQGQTNCWEMNFGQCMTGGDFCTGVERCPPGVQCTESAPKDPWWKRLLSPKTVQAAGVIDEDWLPNEAQAEEMRRNCNVTPGCKWWASDGRKGGYEYSPWAVAGAIYR